MPELPEVERFRRILLPLVTPRNSSERLRLELVGKESDLPRKWLTPKVAKAESGRWCCTEVARKGKLLCMVLERPSDDERRFLFLHMGMTGRLSSPTESCSWGHAPGKQENDDDDDDEASVAESFPPRFTYLVLRVGDRRVAFADPRKFGACRLSTEDERETLAPDALLDVVTETQRRRIAVDALADQRLGVKALLLDQKRVVSGVGNWVADEVLYQMGVHPDQRFLTTDRATELLDRLRSLLEIAVECLDRDAPYPETWLFGHRWTGKKAGKDFYGRQLTFVTSGGRTSAIVASLQKLRGTTKKATSKSNASRGAARKRSSPSSSSPSSSSPSSSPPKEPPVVLEAVVRKKRTKVIVHVRDVVDGVEVSNERETKKRRRETRERRNTIAAKKVKVETKRPNAGRSKPSRGSSVADSTKLRRSPRLMAVA